MQRRYNKENIPKAKELRKNMTKEEKQLWYDFLRDYPVKFYRQKVMGRYIEVHRNFKGVCEYIDDIVKRSFAE